MNPATVDKPVPTTGPANVEPVTTAGPANVEPVTTTNPADVEQPAATAEPLDVEQPPTVRDRAAVDELVPATNPAIVDQPVPAMKRPAIDETRRATSPERVAAEPGTPSLFDTPSTPPAQAPPRPPTKPAPTTSAQAAIGAPYSTKLANKVPLHAVAARAVAEWGTAARWWVAGAKERYPEADPDGLARLAEWEWGRRGRREAAATGAARLIGPVAVSGPLLRTQVQLVLTIAAVYGFDPTSPDRIDELVELLHAPSLAGSKVTAAARTAKNVAALAARILAARLVPFGGAAAAVVQGSRATTDVAARARTFYRTGSAQ